MPPHNAFQLSTQTGKCQFAVNVSLVGLKGVLQLCVRVFLSVQHVCICLSKKRNSMQPLQENTLNVLKHTILESCIYVHESQFLDKCNVCAQAYASLFKDAIRVYWGRMEDLFLFRPANVPEGARGGNTGDRERGRAQLWGQIASLELGQHRQRPGRPCALVVSLLSLSPCIYVHPLTPPMSLWSSVEQ